MKKQMAFCMKLLLDNIAIRYSDKKIWYVMSMQVLF